MNPPSESDDLARELLDIIPNAMRLIRKEMRERRGGGLSVPQFRALLFLKRNPGAHLKSLAEHLGLTAATVSKMVNGLVAGGLVERPDSAADRRSIEMRLTAKGSALVDRVRNETAAALAMRIEALPAEERDRLAAMLAILQKIFRTDAASGQESKR